ncbi:MAG: glycine cleavage system protein H [Bdellovibrionota bacterium]
MKESPQEFQEGLLWQTAEGDLLTIGVTQSALDQVGTVQEIEIADAGDEFEAGDWIGEIRGKETLVEMLAPCRLRISERNEQVLESPSVLEDDPTGDAWMMRVEKLDE